MRNITVRLAEELIEELEAEADEHGKTRSEHIRDTLVTRHEHNREHAEYEQQLAEYEQWVEELEMENERLRNEKRLIIEQREEHTELREYVEEERSWREAGLFTRMRWWVLGKDE